VNVFRLVSVALGGALGTLARLGAEQASTGSLWGPELAILVVNLVGASALGVAHGHGLPALSPAVRDGITIGLIGSYTTMSAVAVIAATATLTVGLAYLALTMALGFLAAWVGLVSGRRLPGATPRSVDA